MMMHREADRELGLGIIELIVYAALSAIILAIVASVFVSGTLANEGSSGRNQTTVHALWVSDSLAAGIRNASEVKVTLGGDRLDARVASGDTGWQCQAWMVIGGDLFHTASASAIPAGTGHTGWGKLADGVRGTLSGGHSFRVTGSRVEVRLTIIAEDVSTPVVMDIIPQARGEGTPATC